jgi:hypothetical protein
MGFGIGEVSAAMALLGTLYSATKALWKIANDDGKFKESINKTFESIQKTQASVVEMVQDHEARLRIIEREVADERH